MSIYRQRLLAQQALIPRPIAAWSAKGKTNEDEDRAILKDLTGNGHDITLNNFAFSGISGYGGHKNYAQGTENEVKITGVLNMDNYVANLRYPVQGLKKGDIITISFDYVSYNIDFSSNSRIILKFGSSYNFLMISSDYITTNTSGHQKNTITLTNHFNSTDPVVETDDGAPYIRFDYISFNEGGYFLVKNFTVVKGKEETEWFKDYQYPDALVFDGVDDYGVCKNMPIQNDFTLIIKRDIFSPTNFCTMSKSSKYGNGAFILDEMIDYADGYYQWSYGLSTWTTNNNFYQITFMTPTSYNQSPIVRGVGVDTHFIYLGTIRAGDNRHFKGAFYCAYLFGRTLSEQEIKTFIRANIDPLYMLPSEIPENEPIPDCYYDFSLGSNEDENRDTIIDYSGNGNNAVAHNFAWGGMSGYGGSYLNFNTFYNYSKGECQLLSESKIVWNRNSKNTWDFSGHLDSSDEHHFKIKSNKPIRICYDAKYRKEGETLQSTIKIKYWDVNANEEVNITLPIFTNYPEGSIIDLSILYFNTDIGVSTTIELLPEYPGALVLDGTDDYISLDAFDSGFKTMFMLCRPLKYNTILYDQRYAQSGNTTDDFAVFCGWVDIAYNSRNINGTYINGKQNTSIICYNLLNKKHLIHIKSELTRDTQRPTIGSNYKGSSYFAGMAIYKFLGFKEYLDEEQIQYVINKYNLLEGVDELESSEV